MDRYWISDNGKGLMINKAVSGEYLIAALKKLDLLKYIVGKCEKDLQFQKLYYIIFFAL